jgi:hypothetical protein
MFGKRRQELKAKEEELAQQAEAAQRQQREVSAKESFIYRLTSRLGEYHEENHVTAHVLTLFGSGRR